MKDVDEINNIHKSLGDIQNKINELYKFIETDNSAGRDTRVAIYRERIDLLTEDYNKLKEKLKEAVKE